MTDYCLHCMLPTGGADVCPHCGYQGGDTELLHHLRPGSKLNGRYLVGRSLGQGGFGITYIGRDLLLDTRVAIKEYYPSGVASRNVAFSPEITISDQRQVDSIEEGKRKFLSEARALAQFADDPGVVTVRDFFEANNTAYIVMEYLDGHDLRSILRLTRFSADDIFERMRPVMDALEKIHQVGIIHRDISPDNIMLLKSGTVKLMDFGAARQLDLTGNTSVSVILKTGFAPEEQYRSKGHQGPWTDVYALCATIYCCITGLKPDDALERAQLDELKWPSELGVEISALQETVLKKGMAVRAEDRFQSIGEMKEMLFRPTGENHALELDDDDDVTRPIPRHADPDPHHTPPEPQPVPEQKARKKWLRPLAALLAVAVLATGIWGASRFIPQGTGRNGGVSQADIDSGNYMRIILTAHEEMPVHDFAQAADTVEARIDLLCDGQPYDFAVEDDQIKLFLPRSVIEPLGLEKTMQCYISRPIEFSLINFQEFQTDRSDSIRVTPSDVESITIETQAPEDCSPPDLAEALEKGGLEKLVFTEEFVQKNRDKMAQWGTNMVLAQDIESSSNLWYTYLYSAGDGRTFYITNTDGAAFARLLQHNLSQEPLPNPFYYQLDVNYEAAWETPDTGNQAETFQRSPDQVTGQTVTLLYPWVDSDALPGEGRWADACAAMKRRLDLLGEEYAFGTICSGDTYQMVVKTGAEHMSIPLLQLQEFRQVTFYLSAGLNNLYVRQLDWISRPDGTYALEATAGSSEEDLANFLQLAQDAGYDKIYLKVNNIPWLACNLEDGADGTVVTLDQGCFWDNQPIGEEQRWLVQLLTAISQDVNLPSGASTAQYQCNEDENGVAFDDANFSMQYGDLTKQVRDNIENCDAAAQYEQMEVVSDGMNIRVYLHMNTGKNFASQVVALTKALYEQSGLEHSPADGLYLYFIDENDVLKERARIWFSKTYGTGSILPGYVTGGGIFTGGRMEEYLEELQSLIEDDPFFLEKKGSPDRTFCEYTAWW